MHNQSYENELNLHVNDILFSYERMCAKTRFEKELTVIRKWSTKKTLLKVAFRLYSSKLCDSTSNMCKCVTIHIQFT